MGIAMVSETALQDGRDSERCSTGLLRDHTMGDILLLPTVRWSCYGVFDFNSQLLLVFKQI